MDATRPPTRTWFGPRWLLLARAAFVLLALAGILVFVLGTGALYNGIRQPCAEPVPTNQTACLESRAAMQTLGFDDNTAALYFSVGLVIEILPWVLVGLLIFWRKSDDALAILFATALVLFGTVVIDDALLLWAASRHSVLPVPELPLNMLVFFGLALSMVWYLFPDGRFVPGWTRVLALLWLARVFISIFFWGSFLDTNVWPEPMPSLVPVLFVASLLYSLLYRYRRSADARTRRQIKWVVVGATVFGLIYASRYFITYDNTPSSTLMRMASSGVTYLASAFFAVSVGFSILRYRLFDIDLILRRTAVYLPLTAILAGILAVSTDVSKNLFLVLTGENSEIATVLATLIVVAAFEPVKNGLQNIVDRRFKEAPDPRAQLSAFQREVRSELGLMDARRVTRRLLDEAMCAFEATGGAVFLGPGELPARTRGAWQGAAALRVPLAVNGTRLGELALSARQNGLGYSEEDRVLLGETARVVAEAIHEDGGAGD